MYNSSMQSYLRLFLSLSLILAFVHAANAQPTQPMTILSPGEGSLVTAPIEVTAMIHAGEDGLVRLTLVDRKQNLLARQLLRVDALSDSTFEFSTLLAFEIPTDTTSAILTITTKDRFHRPLAMRSAMLNLANGGEEQILLHLNEDPWLTVTQPEPGAVISDSPLLITGTVRPINETPIYFELMTERGRAIFSKQLAVETPGIDFEFSVSLAYSPVVKQENMRLVIWQSAGWPGVIGVLDSLPVIIAP